MPETQEFTIDPLEVDPTFIDVSWGSDDGRLDNAVEFLFDHTEFKTPKKRSDAIENLKRHLRAVIIVCIRAYQINPNVPIASPFSNNFGKPSFKGDFDPFNPKRYDFNKIKEVVKGLKESGFMHIDVGRRDYFGNGYQGKATRFKPTQVFIDYIESHGLHEIIFEKVLVNGGMVMTYRKERTYGRGYKKVLYDYDGLEMPEDVSESREWLPRYNQLIKGADVRLVKQVSKQVIDLNTNVSYRVFHEKRYDYGGRFYGGWWTYCSREDRRYITINDERTVECDYTSNHLYIFYGINNQEMPENLLADPYNLSDDYPREVFKLFITRLFNCPGKYGIIKHLSSMLKFKKLEDQEDIDLLKGHGITRSSVMREVLDIIYKAHPILGQSTDANQGMILMNWDSKIASYVLKTMTDLGIPTLSIHDSFIVPKSSGEQLKKTMNEAYDYWDIPLARSPIKDKDARLIRNEDYKWEALGDFLPRHTPERVVEIAEENKNRGGC